MSPLQVSEAGPGLLAYPGGGALLSLARALYQDAEVSALHLEISPTLGNQPYTWESALHLKEVVATTPCLGFGVRGAGLLALPGGGALLSLARALCQDAEVLISHNVFLKSFCRSQLLQKSVDLSFAITN